MSVYYRFTDHNSSEDVASVFLQKLPVVRKTAKGAWVYDYGRERFVLDGDGRRFCYPTQDAAWASFKIRKMRQEQHVRIALDHLERLKNLTALTWEDAVRARHPSGFSIFDMQGIAP